MMAAAAETGRLFEKERGSVAAVQYEGRKVGWISWPQTHDIAIQQR